MDIWDLLLLVSTSLSLAFLTGSGWMFWHLLRRHPDEATRDEWPLWGLGILGLALLAFGLWIFGTTPAPYVK